MGGVCSTAGASYKPRAPHVFKGNAPVLAVDITTKRPLTMLMRTPSLAFSLARGTLQAPVIVYGTLPVSC